VKMVVISTPIFKFGPQGIPGYGGLEQLAWLTSKGLAEKGHKVSLVAPDGSECPGVEVIQVGPERQVNEHQSYDRYWKHLLEVDCIVDHSWNKFAYLLKMEGRLKVPVLGVMHAPVNTMMTSLPPVEKPCFVCISQDQCNHFEALYNHEARVAYNGCDTEFYQSLDVPRTDRYLFLARFSTVKSPHICQDVCIATNSGLDLVGDTSITNEPEYLQQCLTKSEQRSHNWDPNKGEQIRMIGSVSRGNTVYWYSRARAFFHLTKHFREPFGLAPIEAMLCGCPVLAWRNGALKETVKHGETGFLVSSESEAIEVIKSGALDSINRNWCREWASQYSIQRMIDRYDFLCQEAVSTGGW
jgi:glycosyltransferase involved in cell wall biosynthesis